MRFKTALKVDLGILRDNYQKIKLLAPGCQLLFVIKSNAYGLGMVPLVSFACKQLAIQSFGCASLGEAVYLRHALPDLEFDLFVLSDLDLEMDGGIDYYLSKRIIPVISSLQKLRWILEKKNCKHLKICLKLDTGMNRLGVKAAELEEVITLLKRNQLHQIYHLMSHFSCSSKRIDFSNANDRSVKQYALYKQMKQRLLDAGIDIINSSIANSGAIEQGLGLEENYIRPGLLMYGLSALDPFARTDIYAKKWNGQNVSALETNIIESYSIKKNDPIGYGAFPAPNDGILVYLALGYGDGILNKYHNTQFYHRGHWGRFVGKISMDMSAVLFPAESEKMIKVGDNVSFWDHRQESLLTIADQNDVIPYEILCNISDRVPRIYIGS
ncbi:MAG: alanine racemase [Oligoflexia bacterium]|nr:alanine racemase [Oligoflexia bacterium]